MHIVRVALNHVRRFDSLEFSPRPGINLITGDNGAGKTSILEALHLMAYARSFRGRVRDGLIQKGASGLDVFVEWVEKVGEDVPGTVRRAGLAHNGQSWRGRLDGEEVSQLGVLCAALAVVTFEPGSHALVSGGSEARRRFLDWGLFHVEPGFLALWRRYSRALKQRNALLKRGAGGAMLDPWDHELAETGALLTSHRQHYLDRLQARAATIAGEISPSLELQGLELQPGWRRQEMGLADALLLARERDRLAGHTSVGPHRADWNVHFSHIPGRESLSRGQAKLTALACLLAQAGDHASERREWPVIALDDLASELDRPHQQRVLEYLQQTPAQVFITATDPPVLLQERRGTHHWFHVEHAAIRRLA